jgi:hypothetical protein
MPDHQFPKWYRLAWIKIARRFQLGVLTWDEALDALCDEDCEVDFELLIGTREEYQEAMAEAGIV